jgi:hypothetical protein
MKNNLIIPVSTFNQSTNFAIDIKRIDLFDHYRPAHLAVRLLNYKYDDRTTYAGGTGLTLEGEVDKIVDDRQLTGRRALIVGFPDVVFEVHYNQGFMVVLRPLPLGLGINWLIYRAALSLAASVNGRLIKAKFVALAAKYLASSRIDVSRITGYVVAQVTESYYIRERTESKGTPNQHLRETRLPQTFTIEEAQELQYERIAKLRLQGWHCEEVSDHDSCKTDEMEQPIAWLCKRKRDGATKYISLEYGFATVADEKNLRDFTETFKCYKAEEIAKMWDTWFRFDGFTAETCGHCHSDVNVFANSPGWHCSCGHYNMQSLSGRIIPHEHPDFGPDRKTIRDGADQSQKWQRIRADMADMPEI